MNIVISNLFFTAALAIVIAGCVADSTTQVLPPSFAAAKAVQGVRVVRVRLAADPGISFVPGISQRTVIAEPVTESMSVQAKGRYQLNDVDVVIIGESCDALWAAVALLESCEESEVINKIYGSSVVSGVTDIDGQVELMLEHSSYRLSLQSEQTAEDSSCRWGGSVELSEDAAFAELPMLVYCE